MAGFLGRDPERASCWGGSEWTDYLGTYLDIEGKDDKQPQLRSRDQDMQASFRRRNS